MYSARQSFQPIVPPSYLAFATQSGAFAISEDLDRIDDEELVLMDRIPALLTNWELRSPKQPFGFVYPWWYEDIVEYPIRSVGSASLAEQAEEAREFFQVCMTVRCIVAMLIKLGALANGHKYGVPARQMVSRISWGADFFNRGYAIRGS